jgi:plasmid stabilization system protein ParE
MAETGQKEPQRIVIFTEDALADLASIDNATASMWGEKQAERYLAFLNEVLHTLAANPRIADSIDERPGYLVFIGRYSKRRTSHGHRIFFRKMNNSIEIIRILHTAMYWPSQL